MSGRGGDARLQRREDYFAAVPPAGSSGDPRSTPSFYAWNLARRHGSEARTNWIETALRDLDARAIQGKAVTPFLLSRIVELSGGGALETNVQLFLNNVGLGCAIAAALAAAPQGAA